MLYEVHAETPTIDSFGLFSNIFETVNFYTGMNINTIIELIVSLVAILIGFIQKITQISPSRD
jgi:tetrahydromethanopterin S-methyltransferase subunit B